MRSARGFSLIEVMIVVTIIGILAAIVMPSYTQYTYRTKRTVAKAALMKIAAEQESWFNDRKAYAASLSALNSASYPADTVYLQSDGSFTTANATSSLYSVTLVQYTPATMANCAVSGALAAGATTFAVKATPVNAQAKDPKCQLLCVSSTGDRAASGTAAAECWTR
jgi:type IV pilus assembly protein PilE